MKIINDEDYELYLIKHAQDLVNITISCSDDDDLADLLRSELKLHIFLGTNLQEELVKDYLLELKISIWKKCR